jgi:hypothetical protein
MELYAILHMAFKNNLTKDHRLIWVTALPVPAFHGPINSLSL